MLKQGIGLVLLCMAGHAFSGNVIVTTTDDVVKADNQCSLREAVEYINRDMPEEGYNGCGGKDSTNIINLSSAKYLLNSQIIISKSIEFRTDYQLGLNDNNTLGKHNAVISMLGKDRLFLIDRTLAPKTAASNDPNKTVDPNQLININFNEISFEGCSADICADMGGLILNKETLTINYGQLLNGRARLGGAIYNQGNYVDAQTGLSHVTIENTLIKGNKATQGGVIYSDIPQFHISQSLIRENEVSNTGSSLFESKAGFDSEQIKTHTSIKRKIESSTVYNNKGYIANVLDAMTINSITALFNTHGLVINAPLDKAIVANSILVNNGTQDCKIEAGGKATELTNNLYGTGCEGNSSQQLGSVKLIAGNNNEGKCDLQSGGILCPLSETSDYTLAYFKPRLLNSYNSASDSPIVNRGPFSSANLTSCSVKDQRGKTRLSSSELCDRGAIELTVDRSQSFSMGQDILYGEIANNMSVADKLYDGELVTPEQCQILFGATNNGKAWQPGCLKIEQVNNTPSKGTLTINQDGAVTYVPNGNWHGADQFNVLLVSTTTRFTDSSNPYISISTTISQAPPNTFQDYKVKTSGGSLGLGVLMGLMGLIGIRRLKK